MRTKAKLHIVSDLHIDAGLALDGGEFYKIPDVIYDTVDFIVIAGDISNDKYLTQTYLDDIGIKFKTRNPEGKVIAVIGNHDFYYANIKTEFRKFIKQDNVHIITHDLGYFCAVFNISFVGDTLWTDYKLNGDAFIETAKGMANSFMSDHSLISVGGEWGARFTADDAAVLHKIQMDGISERAKLKPEGSKLVLVTHHGISPKSVHDKYKQPPMSDLNGSFSSDLETWDVIKKADLVIHGHTHSSFDYYIGDTRVIVNPRGYPMRTGKFENDEYNNSLIVEI